MNSANEKKTFEATFSIKIPDYQTFSNIGAGNFGVWEKDEHNLPSYKLNSNVSLHTDVWHQVGNERIKATAHSGGYVQVYSWDTGPQILNKYDSANGFLSGGYSLISICEHMYSTLLLSTSDRPDIQITFGCGYVKKELTIADKIFIKEKIQAPPGIYTYLHHTISIENTFVKPVELFVIPIWEPNWYPLDPALIMTNPYNVFWKKLRYFRSNQINKKFILSHNSHKIFLEYLNYPYNPKPKPSFRVIPVSNIFCENLTPETCLSTFTSTQELIEFLDSNTKCKAPFENIKELACKRLIFSFGYKCLVNPGESKTVKLTFGYKSRETISKISELSKIFEDKENHKINFIYFSSPEINCPLTREILWHSYYLQSGTIYSSLYKRYFVDQGSAYGYIHGASGGPRDWAFFIIPLIFLKPQLAREMLLFIAGLQSCKSGKIPYALVGYGKPTGAGIHSLSSDLDLFFLWSVFEYLATTFDRELLNMMVPFINSDEPKTFLEHIKLAFHHLKKKVGLGKHGFIRTGSGDWNDPLLAYSPNPLKTLLFGESTFNTLLAIYILPQLATILYEYDENFAHDLTKFADLLKKNIWRAWNGKWFRRGFTGRGDDAIGGDEHLFLDTQPFAILSDIISESEKKNLLREIERLCITNEPFGAASLAPIMEGRFLKPGTDTNGGIWHAINAWLTWAWAKVDPQGAWQFFIKSTLFAHAEAYPNVWYGIWSGPDAYNSHLSTNPGETFNLNFTPMTEFPVMNMNCHAGIMFALIKLLSIESSPNGIMVLPLIPLNEFKFNSELLDIEKTAENFTLFYKPICSSIGKLLVKSPFLISTKEQIKARCGNEPMPSYVVSSSDTIMIETKLNPLNPLRIIITKTPT